MSLALCSQLALDISFLEVVAVGEESPVQGPVDLGQRRGSHPADEQWALVHDQKARHPLGLVVFARNWSVRAAFIIVDRMNAATPPSCIVAATQP